MELPSFLFLKKKGRKNYFTIDKTIRYYLFPITIRYYGLMVTWKAKTCRHFWVIWFKFGRVVAKYWLCYAHWFKYRQSIMFMSCVSSSSFFLSTLRSLFIEENSVANTCGMFREITYMYIFLTRFHTLASFHNYFTNLGGVCNYVQNTSQLCGYIILLMKLEHFSTKMEL